MEKANEGSDGGENCDVDDDVAGVGEHSKATTDAEGMEKRDKEGEDDETHKVPHLPAVESAVDV